MELRGETCEETSQRGDQAAHDGRQSCRFPPAKRYRHRRQQQRHSRGHCSQPSCTNTKTLSYAYYTNTSLLLLLLLASSLGHLHIFKYIINNIIGVRA